MIQSGKAIVLACALVCTAGVAGTKQGGVNFRFDDNKSPQLWRQMDEVFSRYGFCFSLAVNSQQILRELPANAEELKKLSAKGHEVLDHSPDHSSGKFVCMSDGEVREIEKKPFVDHVKGRAVFFKFHVNRPIKGSTFKISVKGNKIVKFPEDRKKNLYYNSILLFPDKKIYGVLPHGKEYILQSFWGEQNIQIPDMNDVEVTQTGRDAFDIHPDGTRHLAKLSVANHKKLGLPAPKIFITPGGWGVFPSDKVISKIYVGEFGYLGGDSYSRWPALYGSSDPGMDRCRIYPCWDSLERIDVKQMKKQIADACATHRVLMIISHSDARNVPGGFDGFLKRHDEVLAWIKEKKIPVRSQAEWVKNIYDQKHDSKENLFPSFTNDLDGDGSPDGFLLTNTVKILGASKISAITPGGIFRLKGLTGFDKGVNRFSFRAEGKPGTEISFEFGYFNCYTLGNPNSKIPFKFRIGKDGKLVVSQKIDIPKWVYGLDIGMRTSGPCILENFSFSM